MNILFYNWEYPPQGSGIGRYNELLTKALRSSGHFCVIVTSAARGCPQIEKIENGIICRVCAKEAMGTPETAQQALALAQHHRIHLIEGADHLGHCAALLRETNRPPVCVKLHYNDVLHDLRYAQAAYFWQRPLIWLACVRQRQRLIAERFSIETADFVTAPSQAILDRARAQGLRLPVSAAVLPNPVDLPKFWQNAEANRPTLLLVSRVDFGKGIQYLPSLLQKVRQRFPSAVLEIAGADSSVKGMPSLLRWLTSRIEGEMFSYLGVLSREALDEAYRRAWVVLSPSRWDTFPNSVLEAMARSKAVTASPFGGAQEMLSGTENPVARPDSSAFAEAACQLIADGELRRRAGVQGRSKAELEYAPGKTAKDYVQFFGRML